MRIKVCCGYFKLLLRLFFSVGCLMVYIFYFFLIGSIFVFRMENGFFDRFLYMEEVVV